MRRLLRGVFRSPRAHFGAHFGALFGALVAALPASVAHANPADLADEAILESALEEVDRAPAEHAPGRALPVASRYAALDRARCLDELGKRKIPFVLEGDARGVMIPLRLAGPLSGVLFRSMLSPKARSTSPYDIYDCRLVLALDDFARILAKHDVVEVVHFSAYRPPSNKRPLRGPGRRHPGGLAIDTGLFKTKDGRTLSVEKDFDGRRGERPCGARAKPGPSELRSIVCEAVDAQLFNVVLTPGFNRAHKNHFHLEVTAGARWVHVR